MSAVKSKKEVVYLIECMFENKFVFNYKTGSGYVSKAVFNRFDQAERTCKMLNEKEGKVRYSVYTVRH